MQTAPPGVNIVSDPPLAPTTAPAAPPVVENTPIATTEATVEKTDTGGSVKEFFSNANWPEILLVAVGITAMCFIIYHIRYLNKKALVTIKQQQDKIKATFAQIENEEMKEEAKQAD